MRPGAAQFAGPQVQATIMPKRTFFDDAYALIAFAQSLLRQSAGGFKMTLQDRSGLGERCIQNELLIAPQLRISHPEFDHRKASECHRFRFQQQCDGCF